MGRDFIAPSEQARLAYSSSSFRLRPTGYDGQDDATSRPGRGRVLPQLGKCRLEQSEVRLRSSSYDATSRPDVVDFYRNFAKVAWRSCRSEAFFVFSRVLAIRFASRAFLVGRDLFCSSCCPKRAPALLTPSLSLRGFAIYALPRYVVEDAEGFLLRAASYAGHSQLLLRSTSDEGHNGETCQGAWPG